MNVARLAGCADVELLYSKGTLLISNSRMTSGVLNRLRPPGDGDILVPGGTVSLLGTSSHTVESPDATQPKVEVDLILSEGAAMVPQLQTTRFIRAFCGVRPLLKHSTDDADGRRASRSFALFDHEDQGLSNFATIVGGKLTTFRLMAEKTGDLVAKRMGIDAPGVTAHTPLRGDESVRWADPGSSARDWRAWRRRRETPSAERPGRHW